MQSYYNWLLGVQQPISGAIDVVAVRGSDCAVRACTPLHVRMNCGAKRGENLVVQISVNGCPNEHVAMKLGLAGEAFFVQRQKSQRSGLTPRHTSPQEYVHRNSTSIVICNVALIRCFDIIEKMNARTRMYPRHCPRTILIKRIVAAQHCAAVRGKIGLGDGVDCQLVDPQHQ